MLQQSVKDPYRLQWSEPLAETMHCYEAAGRDIIDHNQHPHPEEAVID